jgi:predicted Zn-dependent protease
VIDSQLPAEFFDGRSAAPRTVRLQVDAHELVLIDADMAPRRLPLHSLQWPERTRHGARLLRLADGGVLQPLDSAAFDRWAAQHAGRRDTWVVGLQQSWRRTLTALLVLAALLASGYQWGVPLASRAALHVVPESVDRELGALTLSQLQERGWLQPSELPASVCPRLRRRLAEALQQAPAATAGWELRCHKSRLGANAFALPGGTIVLTDELVRLVDGSDDVLLGVLAHEHGHLQQRHGMRLLLQTAVLGVATSAAFGDFSSLMALAPALLGQLAYSRDAEREADAHAVRLLRAAGVSPRVMVMLFDRLATVRGEPALGIALASHPADAERRRGFEQAAPR